MEKKKIELKEPLQIFQYCFIFLGGGARLGWTVLKELIFQYTINIREKKCLPSQMHAVDDDGERTYQL